jgi:hypothetical protein
MREITELILISRCVEEVPCSSFPFRQHLAASVSNYHDRRVSPFHNMFIESLEDVAQ